MRSVQLELISSLTISAELVACLHILIDCLQDSQATRRRLEDLEVKSRFFEQRLFRCGAQQAPSGWRESFHKLWPRHIRIANCPFGLRR
jgi:hypothetical protein